MSKKILLFFGVILVILILGEIGLRLSGFKPKSDDKKPALRVEPNNLAVNDSVLGFRLQPGHYTLEQANTSYNVTIDSTGHRISSLTSASIGTAGPEIIFLGGPSLFGHGVNDDETCPFFFQSLVPAYKVVNMAMLHYGIAENYMQLTHLQGVVSGSLIVYVYHSVHDNRGRRLNQKARNAENSNVPLKNYQYLTIDSNLKTQLNNYNHTSFPFSKHSSLIYYFENAYSAMVNKADDSHQIAEKAIAAMNEWCKARNCKFVLVYWNPDQHANETLEYCRQHNISAMKIKGDIRFKHLSAHGPIAEANKAFADSMVNRFTNVGLIDTALIKP